MEVIKAQVIIVLGDENTDSDTMEKALEHAIEHMPELDGHHADYDVIDVTITKVDYPDITAEGGPPAEEKWYMKAAEFLPNSVKH